MNSNDFTTAEIEQILSLYKSQKMKNKERYEQIKDTESFKIKNRQRANKHYHENKSMYRERYENDKQLARAKSTYYYYKKNGRLNDLSELSKHKDKYELLKKHGYFNDQKPSASTTASPISSSHAEPSSSERGSFFGALIGNLYSSSYPSVIA